MQINPSSFSTCKIFINIWIFIFTFFTKPFPVFGSSRIKLFSQSTETHFYLDFFSNIFTPKSFLSNHSYHKIQLNLRHSLLTIHFFETNFYDKLILMITKVVLKLQLNLMCHIKISWHFILATLTNRQIHKKQKNNFFYSELCFKHCYNN